MIFYLIISSLDKSLTKDSAGVSTKYNLFQIDFYKTLIKEILKLAWETSCFHSEFSLFVVWGKIFNIGGVPTSDATISFDTGMSDWDYQ